VEASADYKRVQIKVPDSRDPSRYASKYQQNEEKVPDFTFLNQQNGPRSAESSQEAFVFSETKTGRAIIGSCKRRDTKCHSRPKDASPRGQEVATNQPQRETDHCLYGF
jgi:hypothetical protein